MEFIYINRFLGLYTTLNVIWFKSQSLKLLSNILGKHSPGYFCNPSSNKVANCFIRKPVTFLGYKMYLMIIKKLKPDRLSWIVRCADNKINHLIASKLVTINHGNPMEIRLTAHSFYYWHSWIEELFMSSYLRPWFKLNCQIRTGETGNGRFTSLGGGKKSKRIWSCHALYYEANTQHSREKEIDEPPGK